MDKPFTFQDIFTKKFLESFTPGNVDFIDIGIALALCLLLGLAVFFVYRRGFTGVVYDHGYAVSLVLACVITGIIIKAITFNIVLSLGMVGALSIIRFRTAVKDPVDIIFMFWSIAVGIICGAGIYPLAVIGSVVIAIIFLIMTGRRRSLRTFLLVVHGGSELDQAAVERAFGPAVAGWSLKSKVMEAERTEICWQVKLKTNGPDALDAVRGVAHIANASLVSYNPNAAP